MNITVLIKPDNQVLRPDENLVLLSELDSVPDASCLRLDLNNCLDFVPFAQREPILKLAINKLRLNGVLNWYGADLTEFVRNVFTGMVGIPNAQSFIYAEQQQSTSDLYTELAYINRPDLEVVEYGIDGPTFTITIRRVQ